MRRSPRPTRPAALLALALAVTAVASSALATSARAANPTITVRPGDTLSGLALRHRTTVARLVALNHIADPNRIFAGQRLIVSSASPGTASGTPPAAGAASSPSARSGTTRIHVVAPGEHLTGIARRYGTTIDALVHANHIANPNRIFAGQRLLVPGFPATGGTAPATSGPSGASFAGFPADVARRMRSRVNVRDLIAAEARRANVPVGLALGLAWQESGWQQGVTSTAGAVGVMQLTPATGDWVAASMLGAPVNLRDIRQNVRAGVTLLRHYLTRYHGDRTLSLAAYYQGQRSVDLHGVYASTRPYVASILALAARLG